MRIKGNLKKNKGNVKTTKGRAMEIKENLKKTIVFQ